ncbi:MAG: DUF1080 domain-containing protein [bacterium]|nr:DUF1080 domain-containing protein [bacterium]
MKNHIIYRLGMAALMVTLAFAMMPGCITGSDGHSGASQKKLPKGVMPKVKCPEGYAALFKNDLSNALMAKDGWTLKKGELVSQGKGDIWTKERYGNFALDLEFKCAAETNSGIFIRCDSIRDWLHTSIEVQVLQPNDHYENDKHHCGGIFDCLAPSKLMVKAPGEWNRCLVVANNNRILVELNGEIVVDTDLNEWTEAHKNPDGTKNKFKTAYKDMPREGHIGFQYHGQPVSFRNIKIKSL